ncbi:hypothetical protein F5I97DRAFT_1830988 [Phlebopus sp. FC_14]|nr:hypothetical protein F5I97DRAFT_1830988 [Phlebopus sp. FC_14]
MSSSTRSSAINEAFCNISLRRFFRRLAKLSFKAVATDELATSPSAGINIRPTLAQDFGHELGDDMDVDGFDLADFVVIPDMNMAHRSIDTTQRTTRRAGSRPIGRDHHQVSKTKRPRPSEECEDTYRPVKRRHVHGFGPSYQKATFTAWLPGFVQLRQTNAKPPRSQGSYGTFEQVKSILSNQDPDYRGRSHQSKSMSTQDGHDGPAIWLTRPLKNNWTSQHPRTAFRHADGPTTEKSSCWRNSSAYTSCFASGSRLRPSVIRWKSV